MKAILALGLLAVLGFSGAGCASGKKKPVSLTFAAPTTTTLSGVKAGDTVRCGAAGAEVPSPGQGVTANADGITSSGTLQLKWKGGVLQVACKLAHLQSTTRPSAAGNKRKATLEAVRLLGLFVPPPHAVRLPHEPAGDQALLRRRTISIGGQAVYRIAIWRAPEPLDSVVAFVKRHPPRSLRPGGRGTSSGRGIPANRTLDYLLQQPAGRPARWIEINIATYAAARPASGSMPSPAGSSHVPRARWCRPACTRSTSTAAIC